jgi:uncharacterized protein (TIGR00369 family)
MADAGGPSPVTVSPEVFLAMGREVLAKQPFSVLLGAQLNALAPGRCELQVTVAEHLKQQHGFVHGGVLGYLADNALTYAGGTALRVPVLTGEFKINYVRPAVGDRLVARAEAVHVGKTQAVCRCEVYAIGPAGEKLCALAQGTIVAAPEQTSM